MTSKILLVDDEANILNGYKRHLHKHFQIDIALSGEEGLKLIENNGPFAVVVSDMAMPRMNGIEFLKRVKKQSADTVRLMLTGNLDQKTVIDAVNNGDVFRFLNKPCQPEQLANVIKDGVTHYDLITAERGLLEDTLNGTINLLTDILSMVSPDAFGRVTNLRECARELGNAMEMPDTWAFEMAAMLYPISKVTLPTEILTLQHTGKKMSDAQEEILAALPETASKLLKNIPRLEKVAEIVLYHEKHFDGTGFPPTGVSGINIPLESRALKILIKLVDADLHGLTSAETLSLMKSERGQYDPDILTIAASIWSDDTASAPEITNLRVVDLLPGQKLLGNIENQQGQLLVAPGNIITDTILKKLMNLHKLGHVKEPILVELSSSVTTTK